MALAACDGVVLDGGSTLDADTSPLPSPVDLDGSASPGLTVDGTACTIAQLTPSDSVEWPAWRFVISASCGQVGPVRMVAIGHAAMRLPQPLSPPLQLLMGVDNEGDAGTLYYVANGTTGSGTMQRGPSESAPGTPLAFEAHMVHGGSAALTHDVKLVAP